MREWLAASMMVASVWSGGAAASGQGVDAALRDRVAQLVERLGSDDAVSRASAAEALGKLGPRILPLLPEVKEGDSTARGKALAAVRETLAQQQEEQSVEASRVTIVGEGIRLSEALKQLQSQTGNPLSDLREEPSNPALDLRIEDKPFFEALDEIAEKAGLEIQFYTGDGSIGIMSREGMEMEAPAGERAAEEDASAALKPQYPGPFRVVFRRFDLQRDLSTGRAAGNAMFEVAWEPRIRPMLLAIKAEDVMVQDDRGESVAPQIEDESASIVLRQENPISEVNVNLNAPDRQAGVKSLKSVKVKSTVSVPAGLRTFRFPNLTERNRSITQGDVKLTLEQVEVDESVWKVNVTLELPGEGGALESYQQGLFNNRLWLQKADGSRFEHNGGFSNTGVDGGKLSYEYLFVDAPGKPADYQFVYETPSRLKQIPLEFEFKNVKLP
jgi:hypothetical protein